jgi:hypothetical protein
MMQLSSLSAIFRTRLKWQTSRTKIDDQADIEQCSNDSVSKHRQVFESAGCDAVPRVSGSRGEEDTSVKQQQLLKCARHF